MAKPTRYQQMEQFMTKALITNAAAFVLYLIFAGAGVVWLQVILAIVSILVSVGGLVFLYLSQELLRQRSLWLSAGFFSLLVCLLASLILAFP